MSRDELESVLALAESAGACSFAQGHEAARQYLLGDDGNRLHALACKATGRRVRFEAIREVTLEAVAEGHTASVLRLGLTFSDRPPQQLALLVARDLGAAAARLSAQASDLRVWHRLAPALAAEVLDDGGGQLRWFGQLREVPVVATRWIEGHRVRVGSEVGLTIGDEDGEGRELDGCAVAQRLAMARSALATFAIDGACERTIELEQGDVMATSTGAVVLVGSGARSWWGPLGAWPYRLAALLHRGPATTAAADLAASMDLASEVVLAGLGAVAHRDAGPALLSVMLRQARSPELALRALEGLVPSCTRAPLIAAVQCALAQAQASTTQREPA